MWCVWDIISRLCAGPSPLQCTGPRGVTGTWNDGFSLIDLPGTVSDQKHGWRKSHLAMPGKSLLSCWRLRFSSSWKVGESSGGVRRMVGERNSVGGRAVDCSQ